MDFDRKLCLATGCSAWPEPLAVIRGKAVAFAGGRRTASRTRASASASARLAARSGGLLARCHPRSIPSLAEVDAPLLASRATAAASPHPAMPGSASSARLLPCIWHSMQWKTRGSCSEPDRQAAPETWDLLGAVPRACSMNWTSSSIMPGLQACCGGLRHVHNRARGQGSADWSWCNAGPEVRP